MRSPPIRPWSRHNVAAASDASSSLCSSSATLSPLTHGCVGLPVPPLLFPGRSARLRRVASTCLPAQQAYPVPTEKETVRWLPVAKISGKISCGCNNSSRGSDFFFYDEKEEGGQGRLNSVTKLFTQIEIQFQRRYRSGVPEPFRAKAPQTVLAYG